MTMRAMAAGERRCVRLLAAVACVLGPATATADGTAAGRFAVWAIGLPHGYVVMEHQTPILHITAEDVAKGMVQVTGGSRFSITTHASAGYRVEFVSRGTLCDHVVVDGIGPSTRLGSKGGTVAQRESAAGKRAVSVSYQCFLAADATPGSYPWPLEMNVREIAPGDYAQPAVAGRLVAIGGREP